MVGGVGWVLCMLRKRLVAAHPLALHGRCVARQGWWWQETTPHCTALHHTTLHQTALRDTTHKHSRSGPAAATQSVCRGLPGFPTHPLPPKMDSQPSILQTIIRRS